MHEKCDRGFRARERHRAQRTELRLDHVILDLAAAATAPSRKVHRRRIPAGRLPARLRPSPNMIAQAFTPAILPMCATTLFGVELVIGIERDLQLRALAASAAAVRSRRARSRGSGRDGAGSRCRSATCGVGNRRGRRDFGRRCNRELLGSDDDWLRHGRRGNLEPLRIFLGFRGERRRKCCALLLLFLVVAHAQRRRRQILQHFLQRQRDRRRASSRLKRRAILLRQRGGKLLRRQCRRGRSRAAARSARTATRPAHLSAPR